MIISTVRDREGLEENLDLFFDTKLIGGQNKEISFTRKPTSITIDGSLLHA